MFGGFRLGACVLPLLAVCMLSCGGDSGTSSSTPQPDLVIRALTFDPGQPLDGQVVTVRATVQNVGNASADLTHTRVKLEGQQICGTVATMALAPGETTGVTCATEALAAGTYHLGACTDVLGISLESNETNNCRNDSLIVSVRTVPDLVVQSISFVPTRPDEGDTVTATIRVLNVGTSADTTHTEVKVDGAVTCASIVTRDLDIGQAATLTCVVGTLSPGAHSVVACADRAQEETESDEANNCLDQPLLISVGLPDLVIRRIYWVPPAPTSADSISFFAVVENRGVGTAAASLTGFMIGTTIYPLRLAPALAPGDSVTVIGPRRRLVTGDHEITCMADGGQTINELDETNNRETYVVTVTMGQP